MGKSAGKWIKTVIFGKKYSKSNISKNVAADKKTCVKTPAEDTATNSPAISDPCQLTERGVENLELEKGTSGFACDTIGLSLLNQGVDSQSDNTSLRVSDTEKSRQDHAATIAQSAFRGYLARRAFRALKGIIRLQALIRGHLVRRQAVATFRCTRAIVKLQAFARKDRHADTRSDVSKKHNVGELQVDTGDLFLGSEKLVTNTFVLKFLLTLPTAVPLGLQYDLSEPNSAWNWLERWSISRFWETPAWTEKMKTKPQKTHGVAQIFESEVGISRRTIRKVSAVAYEGNGISASSEVDKPKRNPRNAMSNPTEFEEQPQNELERVKRNLRKISASAAAAFEKTQTETEKSQPLQGVEKATNSAPPDVTEQEKLISSERLVDSDVAVDKLDLLEVPLNATTDEPVDVTHGNYPFPKTRSLENGLKMDDLLTRDDKLSCKEEQSHKDNYKIQKRSLPAKHESQENISQNSRSLPSYMAATESAKAKLRAQGSSKFGEDGTEYGIGRRHSLPASSSGKWSSSSPRMQRNVVANGKGSSKIYKSSMSSKDDQVVQPGWRR